MEKIETECREQICRIGKLLYDKGLIVGTEGNISFRLPDKKVLITPAGKCKGMMVPDDVVAISETGSPIGPGQRHSSEFRLHLYGYSQRPDFVAAVHAHPPYLTAFALAGFDLDAEEVPEFRSTFGQIPLVPYAPPGTQELAESLGEYIHHFHTFLLESHGVIAFGENLLEAFFRVEMAEQIAKTIYLSRTLVDVSLLEAEDDFLGESEIFPNIMDQHRRRDIE